MQNYDIFLALAEPNRRHIIEMLAKNGELSASDISLKFKISPPAVSQHLKVLREANLVKVEKKAQQRIYQFNPDSMNEMQEWLRKMTEQWNERFNRLDKVLKTL